MGRSVVANPTGRVELLFNPYQQAFLQAKRMRLPDGKRAYRRFALFAGRRGGKTRIGAVGAAEEMTVPNSLGWACAPSYPELHDYVIPAVFDTVPQAWIDNWSEQHQELTLINGAKCQFRSLDDPDRARGPGLDWLWIDECRKVAELAWKTAIPALSSGGPACQAARLGGGVAWVTTSPNGNDWTYRTFWVPAQDGRRGYWACKYTTADNPAIDPEEIADAKASMDPLFYQQEYLADFVSFTGAVYGNLVPRCLLESDEQIKKIIPEWPRISPERTCLVGLDPGADHPFAAAIFIVTEAGIVQVAELLERNRPVADIVLGLRHLLARWNPDRPFQVDRWAIDRTQRQWAIELAQHGIYCTASESDVVAGINRVSAWMASGRLFIIKGACPRTVEQLQGYRWNENYDPRGEARREKVIKTDDDLPDAVRYGLMLWPELPEPEPTIGVRTAKDLPEESRWAFEREQRCNQIARGDDVDDDDGEDGWGDMSEEGIGSQFWN